MHAGQQDLFNKTVQKVSTSPKICASITLENMR